MIPASISDRKYQGICFALVLLVLVFYVPRQMFGNGLSFFGDEIFLNYWSWRVDWQLFVHVLPTGKHDDRPMGWLLINLLYELFGLNYRVQLFSILFIHYLNSLLLFKLSTKLFVNKYVAMIIALAFALHFPANSAALYIGAVFDLLCCTFMLASIIYYLDSDKSRINASLIVSLFFFYLSLRSKEMSLLLPVVLLTSDLLFRDGNGPLPVGGIIRNNLPFMLVSLLTLSIFLVNGRIGASLVTHSSPYYMDFSLMTCLLLFNHYFSLLTWIPEIYYPALIFIILLALAILLRHRVLLWSLAGFLLIISPVLFYKNHVFDIFLYLPHVFFSIMVGCLVDIVFGEVHGKLTGIVIVLCILSGLSLTFNSKMFKDKMRMEIDNRRSIDLLIDYLRDKYSQAAQYKNIYLAQMPDFYRKNGKNWHLTNIYSLVYHDDTFSVYTDGSDDKLYHDYLLDKGSKIYLRYRNGYDVVAESNDAVTLP